MKACVIFLVIVVSVEQSLDMELEYTFISCFIWGHINRILLFHFNFLLFHSYPFLTTLHILTQVKQI